MAMMKPYYEITDDEQDRGIFQTKFPDYNRDVIILEHYCVNKNCTCTEVLLTFQTFEEPNPPNPLLSLRLDYTNWSISDVINLSPEATKARMVDEFKTGLNEELKKIILSHAHYAKDYAVKANMINAEYIRNGSSVGYVEVYGDEDSESFRINDGPRAILVDDSYCMNPKCDCNEALLSFMDISPLAGGAQRRFALRYHLRKGNYEIIDQLCGREELEKLTTQFFGKVGTRSLLKQRYEKMRKAGKQIIAEEHQAKLEATVKSSEVGRNDPCPCGSGKKYKKCCV